MITRPLASTGIHVSALGLGWMGMSDVYGPADRQESIATIHAALGAGIVLLGVGSPAASRLRSCPPVASWALASPPTACFRAEAKSPRSLAHAGATASAKPWAPSTVSRKTCA